MPTEAADNIQPAVKLHILKFGIAIADMDMVWKKLFYKKYF